MIAIGLLILLIFLFASRKRKTEVGFLDIYLLFCLYFDAMRVFAGRYIVLFGYLQALIFIVFAYFFLVRNHGRIGGIEMYLSKPIVFFLGYIFATNMIRGGDFDYFFRGFILYNLPLLILPISFSYYANRGKIKNLYLYTAYFTIFWVLFVALFTVFRIDTVYRGGHLGSRSFGLGLIYFGDMGARGAISYMALALLLSPLILKNATKNLRLILIVSYFLIIGLLLLALKRFSLVALMLGMFNYFLSLKLKIRHKIALTTSILLLAVPAYYVLSRTGLMAESYNYRRGEAKISYEAIESDVRLYEPVYVASYLYKENIQQLVFGDKTDLFVEIDSDRHSIASRKVHNQYAQYMMIYGLIGMIAYILIFYRIYIVGNRLKKRLNRNNMLNHGEWIVFQNIIVIYFLGGFVGGQSHFTYRAIAMLFSGAFCGSMYKKYKQIENKGSFHETSFD